MKEGQEQTPALKLFQNARKNGSLKRLDEDMEIDLKKEEPIKNRFGETAARIFVTRYPQNLNPEDGEGLLTKGMRYIRGSSQPRKQEKVLMLLGLTGSGKTTFVDALINFIFNTRYEFRLKLIRITKDEIDNIVQSVI